MGLSPEAVAAWLSASCAEQGVPVRVSDPQVLAKVAALLPAPVAGPANARSASGDSPGLGHTRQIARTRDGSSDRAPS
jgi:hypothetical protein